MTIRLLITILTCLFFSADTIPKVLQPTSSIPSPIKLAMPIVMSVDSRFTPLEKVLILRALEEWQGVSQGKVLFKVLWDQPRPGGLQRVEAGFYIWAIEEEERETMAPNATGLSGLFVPTKNQRDRGHVLLLDRRNPPGRFFGVILHEVGHLLGVTHNPSPTSIMHREATGVCLTQEDLNGLCNIYDCDTISSCPFE